MLLKRVSQQPLFLHRLANVAAAHKNHGLAVWNSDAQESAILGPGYVIFENLGPELPMPRHPPLSLL
ncbi:unnamed protein product [Protopolystoma xenopodis]|uniref:Uncharacterized protein n=1 Tax=Protopolystoma xenopodis TaxID=117903 RepID=A0A448WAH6_9PLAT|nr:unnamed protein product [Protopolystoma xenopodis]